MQTQRTTRANVVILSVEGRLDATTAPTLESAIQAEWQAGTTRLVIELAQVQLISSAALRVLVSGAKQAKRQGSQIVLCALTPEVAKVFGISGLASLFDLYPTLPEALAALGVADEPAPSPESAPEPQPPPIVVPPVVGPGLDQPSDVTADMPPLAVRGGPPASPVSEAPPPAPSPEPPPAPAPVASVPSPEPPPVRRTMPPPPVFVPAPSERVPPPPPVRPPPALPPAGPAASLLPPVLAALLADPRRRPALIGAAAGVAALVLILALVAPGHRHGSGGTAKSSAATTPTTASTPDVGTPPDASSTPADAVNVPPPPPDATGAPAAAADTPGNVAAETVSLPPRDTISLDANAAENQQTRQAVLKRIDLMPVSPTQRDRLYQSLDHARGLGKIITVQFANGRADLNNAAINDLKTALQRPDIARILSDPAAVVVVLGFADPKGSPQLNKDTSQHRADRTLAALRGPCAVPNVMHAVGMGGSEFLDSQHLEKNRVVEVWAVLP